MSWPSAIWKQLKNITADELIRALEKDGWHLVPTRSSARIYRHLDGRAVSVHHHPRKTFGAKLLQRLLRDIGWNEDDLRRLKLIR